MPSANTCSKISAVVRGLSHTVVNHCLLFRCKASSYITGFGMSQYLFGKLTESRLHLQQWAHTTKVCDMPRHLQCTWGYQWTCHRSTCHTCVSSHSELVTSEHRTKQSIIITRTLQAIATCRQLPYLHKPAIIIDVISLWRHSRVSRLRRSQPPFYLWCHSHYDVICYWAGHAQRYRRTLRTPYRV